MQDENAQPTNGMSQSDPVAPSTPQAHGDRRAPHNTDNDLTDGQAAYNIVTDTVVSLNMRKSDNKFQAIFILISVLVCAGLGAGLAAMKPKWDLPPEAGALFGAFAGLVVGLFASGIILMIYRAVRHVQGKHD